MASFGITTARDFLNKLIEDQRDFEASHCQSARHAINAIMTAYHLHEWVWCEFVEPRSNLRLDFCIDARRKKLAEKRKQKEVSPCSAFFDYLKEQCSALEDARKVTNGTKHFGLSKIPTGKTPGPFDPALFDPAIFHVSYLWIDRSTGQDRGTRQRQNAEVFIRELADFWDGFFKQHSIP